METRIRYQVRLGDEYLDWEGRWGSIFAAAEFTKRALAEQMADSYGGEVVPLHDIVRTVSGEYEVAR